MPIINAGDYKPPLLWRNGHLNTMYPYFFRKTPSIQFTRERIETPDDDFVDVDWVKQNKTRLAILMHGLEGSSSSQYILGTALALQQHEWDIAAINFRSCSGELNRRPTLYHSGFTQDLHQIIQQNEHLYDEICLVGFSLGGNVVMKYVSDGVYILSPKIKATVGVSVPCDLNAGSYQIMRKENYLYEKRFIDTIKAKVAAKHSRHPLTISIEGLDKIATLRDIDDIYTAPIHGFTDADDYYGKCNCLQFLDNIQVPSLIINAKDDSFLPDESYPLEIADRNEKLFLMVPSYGGHVGFTTFGSEYYWNENKIVSFLQNYSTLNVTLKK